MKTWVRILLVAVALAVSAAPGLAVEPYSHTNSKGTTYYLFYKEVPLKNSDRVQTIYYFSKDPNHAKGEPLAEVPTDRIVSETKNGLPVLKRRTAE